MSARFQNRHREAAIPRAIRLVLSSTILLTLAAAPVAGQRIHGRVIERGVEPASVFGRVVDAESGRALVSATVRLGDRVVATDARGWFELRGVTAGNHAVSVEMLGYAARVDSVTIEEGVAYDVEVRLSRQPIELAPIAVTVRSPRLESAGYYERISSGLSPRVITAADFERRGATAITDLFHDVPGVRVVRIGTGSRVVRMMHNAPDGLPAFSARSLPGCEPALYIDGQIRRDQIPRSPTPPRAAVWVLDWDDLSPLVIEAIEVYRGAATPVEYPHPCGVVLVWTRR
jgi:hypothetical protein